MSFRINPQKYKPYVCPVCGGKCPTCDVEYQCIECEHMEKETLTEVKNKIGSSSSSSTLTVHVYNGVVDHIDGLPNGWLYDIVEHTW